MKTRLANLLSALGASLWPIPALFAVVAVGLVLGMQAADAYIDGPELPLWLQTSNRSDARQLLAAIFQSVLGAAGITFSVTIAVLSLAAQTYGPRILRNFTADRGAQVVLGIFTAASLYGLLSLPLMEEGVPHLTAAMGTLLGLVAVGALVWFVHHVAVIVQADVLATQIANDLRGTVERVFPALPGSGGRDRRAGPERGAGQGARGEHDPNDRGAGQGIRGETDPSDRGAAQKPRGEVGDEDTPDGAPDFDAEGRSVGARRSGYVQAIAEASLIEVAAQADVVVRLRRRPGDYLVAGTEIADVWPSLRLDPPLARRIQGCFVLGSQRTPEQDLEFAVHELVEMALRAVSPAINDPFMAMACLDRLAEGLARLAAKDAPDPLRYDDAGRLRLVADPFTFPEMLDAAFDLVRNDARGNRLVLRRILHGLRLIAPHVKNDTDREALKAHALRVRGAAKRTLQGKEDVTLLESEVQATFGAIRRWARSADGAGDGPVC